MPPHICRLSLVLSLAVVACDDGHDDSAAQDDRCFPVPEDADFRAARPGHEEQGTSLQGGPLPDRENNGASLQGGPRPGHEEQGTSLQGGPRPGEQDQGTSLQGGARQGQENQGTSLQGTRMQGRFLGIDDLAGVTIALADGDVPVGLEDGQLQADGHPSTASLVGVPLRATTRDGRELALEIVESTAAGLGDRVALTVDGQSVCNDGDLGVFVAGRWSGAGDRIDDPAALTFACDDGVIAKCVAWGYAPWSIGADVHQACTRLARADYCGDGTPWTLDGTTIDVYDALGVQQMVPDPTMHFEAAWGPDGATCVAQTRYDVIDDEGRRAAPSCFAALPACDRLEHPAAATALLADRSAHTPIAACD